LDGRFDIRFERKKNDSQVPKVNAILTRSRGDCGRRRISLWRTNQVISVNFRSEISLNSTDVTHGSAITQSTAAAYQTFVVR